MQNYFLSINITFIFFAILFIGCSNQNRIQQNEDVVYSIEKPIEGQLHTAKRLKDLMSEKKYDEAINLFSKKRQLDIREIQNDKEIFDYWCVAWTLDKANYEGYVAQIKKGEARFIFENGEWKINEK